MATSRRTDLEQGARGPFGDKPLFNHATRRNAYKALSKNLSSPKAFLIGQLHFQQLVCYIIVTNTMGWVQSYPSFSFKPWKITLNLLKLYL